MNHIHKAEFEFNGKKFELNSIFSGMQRFTTIDFPKKTAITLFTGGCNFRCVYCHNPDLVFPERIKYLDTKEIVNFLIKRRNLIEGVVVCGGEPSIHANLIKWIRFLKELGYKVKLDTNATNKKLINQVIEEKLVDYFAIDYKASLENYEKIVARKVDTKTIFENIKTIVDSGIEYEIRTTIHNAFFSKEDITQMIMELKSIGVENYFLQSYKQPEETVGNITENGIGSTELIQGFNGVLTEKFSKTGLRNVD